MSEYIEVRHIKEGDIVHLSAGFFAVQRIEVKDNMATMSLYPLAVKKPDDFKPIPAYNSYPWQLIEVIGNS